MSAETSGAAGPVKLEEAAIQFERATMAGSGTTEAPQLYRSLTHHAMTLLASSKDPVNSSAGVEMAYEATLEKFRNRLSPRAQKALLAYLVDYMPHDSLDYAYKHGDFKTRHNPFFEAMVSSYGTDSVFEHIIGPLAQEFAEQELKQQAEEYEQLELPIDKEKTEADYLLQQLDENAIYRMDMIDDQAAEAKTKLLNDENGEEILSFLRGESGLALGRELIDRVAQTDRYMAAQLTSIYEERLVEEARSFHAVDFLRNFLATNQASSEAVETAMAAWHSRVFHHVYDMYVTGDHKAANAYINRHIDDEDMKVKMRRALKSSKKGDTEENT